MSDNFLDCEYLGVGLVLYNGTPHIVACPHDNVAVIVECFKTVANTYPLLGYGVCPLDGVGDEDFIAAIPVIEAHGIDDERVRQLLQAIPERKFPMLKLGTIVRGMGVA